ncbi:MAG: DUF1289 domain-containing protein [Methylococcales bacterium]
MPDKNAFLIGAPSAVNSPCINICCLNEQDVCLGCWRSLDEIKNWRQVDDATRQDFLSNAKQRRQAAK